MPIDPRLVVELAAEWTGKKAFKQADTATQSLTKNVKKLGKAFGVTFAAATLVNYSKNAVKAFAADEAAAIRLNRAVDNLGISFANPGISKYIAELERSSAIADDILRPAFQALLTTTGSLTQSQKLLNNAITISRASGIDLATVSQDLANGYVGITKGLKKYNSGLTTAELSSKSFAEVLGVLLTKSAGAADDYLQTTQYRMDTLAIATGNASEIIGGGLVNAFARIGGGTEASDAAKAIEDIAKAVAFTTEGIGTLIGVIPNLLKTLGNIPKNLVQGFAGAQVGKNLTPKPTVVKPKADLTKDAQAKLLAKLESDAIKRQKALLALQKKQTDAAKKAAADKAKLDKAGSKLDLEKISIAAALRGKITEEEKVRLLLMQAIADENADKAESLAKKLEDIQKKNEEIAKALTEISKTADPFSTWATSIGAASTALKNLPKYDLTASIFTENMTPEQIADTATAAAEMAALAAAKAAADFIALDPVVKRIAEEANLLTGIDDIVTNVPSSITQTGSSSMFSPNPYSAVGGPGYGTQSPTTITIVVEGNVLDGADFAEKVNDALLNANRTGLPRTAAGFLVDAG